MPKPLALFLAFCLLLPAARVAAQVPRQGAIIQAVLTEGFENVGVEVAEEVGFDGEAHDRERFRRRMLERVLTQCEGTEPGKPQIDSDNLEYLLRKLGDLSAEDSLRRAAS